MCQWLFVKSKWDELNELQRSKERSTEVNKEWGRAETKVPVSMTACFPRASPILNPRKPPRGVTALQCNLGDGRAAENWRTDQSPPVLIIKRGEDNASWWLRAHTLRFGDMFLSWKIVYICYFKWLKITLDSQVKRSNKVVSNVSQDLCSCWNKPQKWLSSALRTGIQRHTSTLSIHSASASLHLQTQPCSAWEHSTIHLHKSIWIFQLPHMTLFYFGWFAGTIISSSSSSHFTEPILFSIF